MTAHGESNLEFTCSCARPDKRIWTQIALDVRRDDLSCDAVAYDEPLICARHGGLVEKR